MASCDMVKSKALEKQVEVANKQLPMSAGNGITVSSVSIEGDYIVYKVDVDESLISIDLLNESVSQMKEAMKAEFINRMSDPDVQKLCKVCRDNNKGIAYHYIGNQSGEKCIVQIESNEL